VTDPLSLYRIEGPLGCGYYQYLNPPPPAEWAVARRVFAAFVRARISETTHSLKPLDTMAQVMRRHPESEAVHEWRKVRHQYDPLKHSKARWISDATLQWVVQWLGRSRDPSVVWCGGVPLAEKLAELTGLPYYGPQGRDALTQRGLHDADPRSSMLCSWHANKRGFNLQAWTRHAIIIPPPSAKALEQIFGRPHRSGQTNPVHFTILATSGGTLDAFAAAYYEAEFCRDTTGLTQKILRADITPLPEPPDNLRWVTLK
jgi:hypothetical protein